MREAGFMAGTHVSVLKCLKLHDKVLVLTKYIFKINI
jgi:hypothetical protein